MERPMNNNKRRIARHSMAAKATLAALAGAAAAEQSHTPRGRAAAAAHDRG